MARGPGTRFQLAFVSTAARIEVLLAVVVVVSKCSNCVGCNNSGVSQLNCACGKRLVRPAGGVGEN